MVEFFYKTMGSIRMKYDKAFKIASKNGHLKVMEFLVEKGANIGEQSIHGVLQHCPGTPEKISRTMIPSKLPGDHLTRRAIP